LAPSGYGLAATREVDIGSFNQPAQTLSFSTNGLGSGFSDKLTFSLTSNLGIDGAFSWSGSLSSTISNFSAQLYRASAPGTPDFMIIGSIAPAGTRTSFGPHYPTDLAPGNYYLLIGGDGAGNNGGRYTATLSSFLPISTSVGPPVTTVPEPGSWAMMLAGLLLMSMRVRRWNRRVAPDGESAVMAGTLPKGSGP
jgi:hypothetical protein